MADEQTAAAATVTSPLSSQSQAQGQSAATTEGQGAGSETTQSSQAGTTAETSKTETTAAVTRPEGLPDTYWDAATNSLKVDPAALANDLKERDELKAFKAADDVRRGSLPATPEAYKVELPTDFKAPPGIDFKFDASDPVLTAAQKWAHGAGLTQEQFQQSLGLYAAAKVGEEAQINAARTREIEKLGPTAPARVDNVTRWLSGMDGSTDKGDAKALAQMLVTARHVEAFERLITRFTNQGTASFSQKHRDVDTGRVAPEVYEKMSYGEKKAYAEKFSAKSN